MVSIKKLRDHLSICPFCPFVNYSFIANYDEMDKWTIWTHILDYRHFAFLSHIYDNISRTQGKNVPTTSQLRSNLDGILDHCRYYRLTTVDLLAPYSLRYSLLIIHY